MRHMSFPIGGPLGRASTLPSWLAGSFVRSLTFVGAKPTNQPTKETTKEPTNKHYGLQYIRPCGDNNGRPIMPNSHRRRRRDATRQFRRVGDVYWALAYHYQWHLVPDFGHALPREGGSSSDIFFHCY